MTPEFGLQKMEIPKLPDTLRTEGEIIATWKGDITKPLVSVRCITYNHVSYIEDAIKGFLIQETDFPIEVWIHDDASTDGTREIVESYQKRYPRIIKTILQDENQYSKGKRPSSFLIDKVKGCYIAFCEGDDYWIDSDKLASQVIYLENNLHVSMSMHSAVKLDYETGEVSKVGCYSSFDRVVTLEEVIEKRYGQIPTASTVVRHSVYNDFVRFISSKEGLTVGDVFLHFFGAKDGGAFYINKSMSFYRLHTEGSFGARYNRSSDLRFRHVSSRVASYLALEEVAGYDHNVSKALKKSSGQFVFSFLKNPDNPYFNRVIVLYKHGGLLDLKKKLMVYPLTFIPFLLNMVRPLYKSVRSYINS